MTAEGAIGGCRWAIAECYIPSASTGASPAMTSHETACIHHTTDRDARRVTVFFVDRDPAGPIT
jgi:hypothetical protein